MLKKSGFKVCLGAVLPLLLLAACSEPGKVDQGRVVAFDKEKMQVTIIRDSKGDAHNPDYSHLPPLTYELPADSKEIGPLPKAGGRMKLDVDKNQIVIFDTQAAAFKMIDFTPVDRKDGVEHDDPLVKEKKFPIIDTQQKTVTIYSKRQKILMTFSPPEAYLVLPDSVWDSGDEVRIFYKEEGKALRFMNVSKTDIYKK